MNETKELLKFIFAAAMVGEKAAADGLDWTDAFDFVPVAALLPEAIGGSAKIVDELKNMNDEQKEELKAYIEVELDLENDVVELWIEKGLGVALELAEFFKKWSER